MTVYDSIAAAMVAGGATRTEMCAMRERFGDAADLALKQCNELDRKSPEYAQAHDRFMLACEMCAAVARFISAAKV